MIRESALGVAAGMVIGLLLYVPEVSVRANQARNEGAGAQAKETQLSPEETELIAAHNRERAAAKLVPLVANPAIVAAARLHARDMAEHEMMSHDGNDGSKPHERITRQGYHGRRTGENIAWGSRTVAEVIRVWMNSPPHRENILGDFSEIGVARVDAEDGSPYWCVTFGLSWPRLNRDEAADQLLKALNRAREKEKRDPLKVSPKLGEAAQKLAQDLATRGDVAGKDQQKGPTPDTRVKQAGYRFVRLGETAAYGQSSADDVVQTWVKTPAHRDLILGKFSEVGVGYASNDKGVPYWTVFFAEPAPR